MNSPSNPHRIKNEKSEIAIKACLGLMNVRIKTGKILNKLGPFGAVPNYILRRGIHELIWLVDQNISPVINEIQSGEFMRDLELIKSRTEINENSSVLYIGSGDDSSVQEVFPQTLNIDLNPPDRTPRDFNFLRADAFFLNSIRNESVDLVVTRCLDHDVLENPLFSKEMARILKKEGKFVNNANIRLSKIESAPEGTDELRDQNQTLRILSNLINEGFGIVEELPNQTALLEKGQSNPNEINDIEAKIKNNRSKFYQILSGEIDSGVIDETVFNKAATIQQILGIPIIDAVHAKWEVMEDLLEPIRNEVPTESFEEIKKIARKLQNEFKL
jgi:hypothetical protein